MVKAEDAAPTPVRGVNAKTLRSVIAAIRRSEPIEIKYQSLSRLEPHWRWIGPHQELSETQQKVIALDSRPLNYGMKDGTARILVRKALLYYALKRLGLDTDPAARRAQDQQIVLLNRVQPGQQGEIINGLD